MFYELSDLTSSENRHRYLSGMEQVYLEPRLYDQGTMSLPINTAALVPCLPTDSHSTAGWSFLLVSINQVVHLTVLLVIGSEKVVVEDVSKINLRLRNLQVLLIVLRI